ncbi:MAG: hypothetical protein IKB05_03565 [Alphaproteobacteria bacterium]|nr:hypothetical protein [Alphaproteobacteria bacterium]
MNQDLVPAYAISNENQRWITSRFQNAKRILTVTGSGDQAMFYSINGAAHVDTYDIALFARVIQDIKTTALKILNHNEYCELIESLNNTYGDYRAAKHIARLLPHLPGDSIKILNKYGQYANFNRGAMYPEHLPTRDEYARMQTTITQPFNFIHTPLNKLHEKISGQYDIINVSNIFDTVPGPEQLQIMSNLLPHLSVGGRLLYIAQMSKYNYSTIQYEDPQTGIKFGYEDTFTHPTQPDIKIISLQRSR